MAADPERIGIEAQRTAIQQFAASESLQLVAEFVEFESGKGADALDRRPELAAALAAAKAAKCSVIVAKLDRLSRNRPTGHSFRLLRSLCSRCDLVRCHEAIRRGAKAKRSSKEQKVFPPVARSTHHGGCDGYGSKRNGKLDR
jgi:hypothetical protein